MFFHTQNNQRGVALIMVLGMVAIIAAWASTATYEDMISIQRIANIHDETSATMASESAYALVALYLKEDAKLTKSDNLEEDWAIGLPPFPIDDGMIAAVIEDSNRFYNLNDLVDDKGLVNNVHFKQLKNLFILLDLDPNLVNALADWMDKNNQATGAYGAEDSSYYEKDYKVKNYPLDNWSELKLILGFDSDVINKLKPHVTVRPHTLGGATKINPNTASAEVLMALFPNMSDMDAEAFIEDRPYSKNNFNSQSWAAGGDVSRLNVLSDAFTLRTHATFGRASVREEFLLSRTGHNTQLLSRERLGWQSQ